MMDHSSVTVKGQIVIPAKLRKKTGIKPGTKVFLEERNGDIIVHPATPGFYDRTFGILKGAELTGALEAFRRRENQHEEHKIEGS